MSLSNRTIQNLIAPHTVLAVSVALACALGAWAGTALAATGRGVDEQSVTGLPDQTEEDAAEHRDELLDSLFERLASAEDERTAQLLEQAVWQIWLRSGSETVDLLMQQSVAALSDEQPEKALEILDAIVDLAPDYAEGWNKRATVLFTMGRYDESMRDIARVLELEPRHFGALSGIGLIRRAIGDNAQALAAFRQALKIHPFLPGALQAIEELSEDVEGQGI